VSNLVSPHSSNQSVSVLRVRPSPKAGGPVKAYVDIQYHNASIKGLSVVQHNGSYFVGFPSDVSKTGKRFPKVEFSDPERGQIEKLVLAAAKEAGLI
jgi:DNA-binding cell septation regulator SpoVG